MIDDYPRVFQTNGCDEKTNSDRNGYFYLKGDGFDDESAYLRHTENEEDDTLQKNGCEGELPRVAHGETDGTDKEGVEAHAWCQSERQFGVNGHDEGADDRCYDGGCENGFGVHALRGQLGENLWVDGEDVRHGQERR